MPDLTVYHQCLPKSGLKKGQILREIKTNFGYNALTDEYEDLVKAGVIDPAKVTKTALANAASVSTLLLTSDALVAEKPKEEKGKGHGHGGDYDMY